MGTFLSRKQKKELLQELKLERMRRYAERIKVILLLNDEKTYKSIWAVINYREVLCMERLFS